MQHVSSPNETTYAINPLKKRKIYRYNPLPQSLLCGFFLLMSILGHAQDSIRTSTIFIQGDAIITNTGNALFVQTDDKKEAKVENEVKVNAKNEVKNEVKIKSLTKQPKKVIAIPKQLEAKDFYSNLAESTAYINLSKESGKISFHQTTEKILFPNTKQDKIPSRIDISTKNIWISIPKSSKNAAQTIQDRAPPFQA